MKCERDGYKFDSLRERAYYDELKLRQKAGDVKEFQVKPTYYFYKTISFYDHKPYLGVSDKKLPLKAVFTYTPDFVVDGELQDVKGVQTAVFRLKAKITAALLMPIKIVK